MRSERSISPDFNEDLLSCLVIRVLGGVGSQTQNRLSKLLDDLLKLSRGFYVLGYSVTSGCNIRFACRKGLQYRTSNKLRHRCNLGAVLIWRIAMGRSSSHGKEVSWHHLLKVLLIA